MMSNDEFYEWIKANTDLFEKSPKVFVVREASVGMYGVEIPEQTLDLN